MLTNWVVKYNTKVIAESVVKHNSLFLVRINPSTNHNFYFQSIADKTNTKLRENQRINVH